MEVKIDDKMYRQLERNVSNNIDENLFDTGRIFISENDKKIEGLDNKEEEIPILSRAEYIRQARESCMRQMESLQIGEQYIDTSYTKINPIKLGEIEEIDSNKEKIIYAEELNSFKSLLIRTICALVIFFSIFLIDKLEVNLGGFSHEEVQEYVTGKDHLKKLEETVVSLIDR